MKFRTYLLFFLLFGILTDVVLGLTLLKDAPLGWKLLMAVPTLAAGCCLPLIAAVIVNEAIIAIRNNLFILGASINSSD